MVPRSPGLPGPEMRPPTHCLREHGPAEAACSDRKLRPAKQRGCLPEVVGSSPPRPLMNLLPLISGVAFEGKGRPRQLECPCLSNPGVLLPLPGHSFDRGLPEGPRVGLT